MFYFFVMYCTNSLAPGWCGSKFYKCISNIISRIDFANASCKISLKWVPQNRIDCRSALDQLMAWYYQAASMSPFGIIRPKWVNEQVARYIHSIENSTQSAYSIRWSNHILQKTFISSTLPIHLKTSQKHISKALWSDLCCPNESFTDQCCDPWVNWLVEGIGTARFHPGRVLTFLQQRVKSLPWRHIIVIANYRQPECLFNSLCELTAKATSKLRFTAPLLEESTGSRWIPLTKGQ